jgi:hypothetical protein
MPKRFLSTACAARVIPKRISLGRLAMAACCCSPGLGLQGQRRRPRPWVGAIPGLSGGGGSSGLTGGSNFARMALIGACRGASGKRSSSIERRSR